MKNDFGKYTREIVSDIPFDSNDSEYQKCKEKVPQFTGQAIYVYSFVKNRMLYAHGWDKMLGYKDEEITLLKLIRLTSERHSNFSNEFTDKALQYIKNIKVDLDKYSFTIELEKIHKNGEIIPLFSRAGIHKSKNGTILEIIGISERIHSRKLGNIMQYAAFGPITSLFEESLNEQLFNELGISRKEKEALELAAKGYAFKEIANKLKVSQSAIEKRIIPLYKRFNVKSLPHLISFAHDNHIL
ncbi:MULTISPECIES: LuxR C-terminal-related transcriptional regulator [unclassified Polaribacter]|jgi:DNA-binding CsgD family transcriptional regulator|uniref:LuxR C-terminal-related transcriptional regulator n=1 Tax=unclassified Polaribacter TaxID=196858 RepID=UPI00052C4A11|nr:MULTISPECIES: LuxR C-terminal-related transcriptional regulator [unclassified Polaribacter]KGL59410.1 transcriptional regulator, LuxR family [Polaribacter sp. Hel1_33_49]MBT4412889.1 helix-turn-helix transcriptional regulator [Polaribacter sp.]MDG1195572.1 LuxR C-terminal-related transcriptional regulator [Polaribacter sp.]PKV63890.1 regulatory LuxR family protein [Polaribacter sp. Hel1_33_96]